MLKEENRLSNINADTDIKSLSKAQFPGPHCPLFGAIMTASYVEDLKVLVIGTEECTYYGKDFAMVRSDGKDAVYSAVLEQHDITFGCEDELREVIRKIDREEKPKALMVVTTCVVELIGEDVSAILRSMRTEVDMKLLIVKTEHFKCNSHIDGIERSLSQLALLMEKSEAKNNAVNILGFKYEGAEDTELYKLLESHHINVAMTIPTKVSIDSLKLASASAVNIVVEPTALGLAQEMESMFNIPYINFCPNLNLKTLTKSYLNLSKLLNIDISDFISKNEALAAASIAKAQKMLKNKSFIYGNTPFDCFEFSIFLMDLGMKPLIIQCRELRNMHTPLIESILAKGVNPYTVRMANIAPLRRLYKTMDVDYYFGHESPMILAENNIIQIVTDKCARKIGYEQISEVVESILEEKGLFSFMGNSKVDQQEAIRKKIESLTKMPFVMKKMLLAMKEIPESMGEALLALDDNEDVMNMMKLNKNHSSMGRM